MFQRFVRSTLTVLFTLMIALTGFVTPAYASTGGASDSFWNGFLEGFGGVVGGAVGTVTTCYAVDVFIAPVAPPVAIYLAGMCPVIGATVGGTGGFVSIKAVLEAL